MVIYLREERGVITLVTVRALAQNLRKQAYLMLYPTLTLTVNPNPNPKPNLNPNPNPNPNSNLSG